MHELALNTAVVGSNRGGRDQFFLNKAIQGKKWARNGKQDGIRDEKWARNGKRDGI